MQPSHPAVTITSPHRLGELNAFIQAFFRNLKSDLQNAGLIGTGFDFGNFSSGQVADPLYNASKKYPRLIVKQSGKAAWIFCSSFSSKCPFPKMLPGSAPSLCFSPHHGTAMEALRDKKLSQDQTFFSRDDFWSWVV